MFILSFKKARLEQISTISLNNKQIMSLVHKMVNCSHTCSLSLPKVELLLISKVTTQQ